MNNACYGVFKTICPITSRSFAASSCLLPAFGPHVSTLRPISAFFNARHFFARATSSRPYSHVSTNISLETRPSRSFHRLQCTSRSFTTSSTCLKKSSRRAAPVRPSRTAYAGRQVPIPFGNIGKKNLDTIFGHDMNYGEGNKMLQILHSRRVTGALVDQGIYIKGTHNVPNDALRKALEWLRSKYPVDEQEAADMWAQQEAQKLEETYIARAERLGLYKKVEDPADISTKNVYGTDSVIDDFKRFHEERRAKEAKEKEKSGVAQQEQELRLARREEREKEEEMRVIARQERQEKRARQGMVTYGQEEAPDLSTRQLLLPSTAFGLAVMGLLMLYGYTYTPPSRDWRLFPDVPTAVATIGGVAAAMIGMAMIWRVPPFWRFLNTYFVQTPSAPRAFSVLGNVFTHEKVLHLLTNLAGMWFFGVEG